MAFKSFLVFPLLGIAAILSACAGPMPKSDPSEAWISLKEEPDAILMAENVDRQRLKDGRFFEVTPGAHKLDMNLIVETNGDNGQEDCQASLTFNQFKAGEHYKLVESSLGQEYRVKLEDSQGRQIGQSRDFHCMPG